MLSEADVKRKIRIKASQDGNILWNNNSGAYLDSRGVLVRYGIMNDSKRGNKIIKSSDLVGIYRILITEEHVGTWMGQPWHLEVKREGWEYTGTPHEVAQRRGHEIVRKYGGRAGFTTGGVTLC